MSSSGKSQSKSPEIMYIVRHGETEANRTHTHQTADTPLSDIGLAQAKLLAHRCGKLAIDHIYSSPFVRTRQTTEAIVGKTNMQVTYVPELREVKRPSELEHKQYQDPFVQKILAIIDQHQHEKDFHYSDEENFFDLLHRAQTAADFLTQQPHRSVLVVSHGYTIRALISALITNNQGTIDQWHFLTSAFSLDNTGICVLKKDGNRWRLKHWNDIAHLG